MSFHMSVKFQVVVIDSEVNILGMTNRRLVLLEYDY